MDQISVSQFSTFQWSFFEDIIRYALHDYSSFGLWRSKVEDYGLHHAADLVHEMKMSVSSVNWVGGFTGSDGRSFTDAVDDGTDAVRFASAIEAACVVVHPGARNSHTSAHANRLIMSALNQLVAVADDYDMCLAIEPMFHGDAGNWTFLDSFQQYLDLVARFPANRVGLVLDLFHVGTDPDVLNRLPEFINRVKLVQLADKRHDYNVEDCRCPLGTGIVPINTWVSTLERLGYKGPLEIELRGGDMDGIDYRDMLGESRAYVIETLSQARAAASSSMSSFDHSGIKS